MKNNGTGPQESPAPTPTVDDTATIIPERTRNDSQEIIR